MSQTHQLVAKTEPSGVKAKDLVWVSSNEAVVKVSKTGLVTPVGRGDAVITVKGTRGTGEAFCVVSVKTVDSLEFLSDQEYVAIGYTRQLGFASVPEDVEPTLLVWSSSNPSVAAVDDYGKVSGLTLGTVEIKVSSVDGKVSDTCSVTVTENIPIEGLAFDITEFTFDSADDVLILTPVFTPENTSQRDLTWISTDETVATVNSINGEVFALSNGKTTIMAKSLYGDFTAVCDVTVNQNIPVKGISLVNDSYTFSGIGQIYLISPVFDPINASNKTISWTSSDPSVASVSEQGVVTSLKKGETTIKMITADGGFTAEFKVIVDPSNRIPVTGVSLSHYSISLNAPGATAKLSASVTPADATEKGIRYSSKNTAVATVSSDGTVKAVGYGTTQIVATSVDGGYSENCTVTVATPVVETPPVEVETSFVQGVWVATVANINFPSRAGLTADQLKAEIDTIMNNVASWGLNTVYFQVRPCSDALYPSQYYPSSQYVVAKQGDPLPLDILAYAVEAAHARGLDLHAWINPYRVTNNASVTLDDLSSSNPAKAHPEWVLTDGTKLYLNPGLPEVRQYIIDGAMEIVKNYDVDGIHFDDYFYPDINEHYDDSAAFAQYGNGLSLADWRRSNNDSLIKGLHDALKAYDSSVEFGVSPAAVWAVKTSNPDGVDITAAHQTYYEAFADTRKWVQNAWVDYICPQVYFQMDHSTAPYKPIVDWWNETVAGTGVRLYIGIGAYRCADTPAYQTGTEIPAQLDYLETKQNVEGVVFYSYGSLLDNHAGVGDQVKSRYYKEPLSTTLQFNQSSMTLDSSYKSTYIVGVSDPNFPLYADGKLVERTREGYFAHYVELTGNKTVVRFQHKSQTVDYTVTRKSTGGSSGSYLNTFSFASGSFTPSYDVADKSGIQVKFSCVAPAGSQVKVQVGSYTVNLSTTTADPGNGKYLKATYSGTLTLPQLDGNGNATLGYPVFFASKGNESVTYSPGCLSR